MLTFKNTGGYGKPTVMLDGVGYGPGDVINVAVGFMVAGGFMGLPGRVESALEYALREAERWPIMTAAEYAGLREWAGQMPGGAARVDEHECAIRGRQCLAAWRCLLDAIAAEDGTDLAAMADSGVAVPYTWRHDAFLRVSERLEGACGWTLPTPTGDAEDDYVRVLLGPRPGTDGHGRTRND